MNLYDAQRSNKAKTSVILVLFVLFFVLMGFGFDYFYLGGQQAESGAFLPVATMAALIFSLLFTTVGYFAGDKMVLASTQARRIEEPANAEEKQLVNVVDEITIAAGIPRPKLYIVPDPDPNAFATGRDPAHASIAVTQGLLNTLNREELQGVIAHELSHVRNYDTLCMTLVAALVGAIGLLGNWALRTSFNRGERSRSSSSREGGGGVAIVFVVWIIAAILAPILARILAMAVSRQREYLADASGAELTRNPEALAHALAKVEQAVAPTKSIKQGMAHLCIADPQGLSLGSKEGFWADLFATHPPMAKRIARLQSMAYKQTP